MYVTIELVIGGVALPRLCTNRFLLYGFNLSFVFFNGALVTALLPLLLRIIYGILILMHDEKPPYGSPADEPQKV